MSENNETPDSTANQNTDPSPALPREDTPMDVPGAGDYPKASEVHKGLTQLAREVQRGDWGDTQSAALDNVKASGYDEAAVRKLLRRGVGSSLKP